MAGTADRRGSRARPRAARGRAGLHQHAARSSPTARSSPIPARSRRGCARATCSAPRERLGPRRPRAALASCASSCARCSRSAPTAARRPATVAALNELGAGALLVASLDADGAVSLAPGARRPRRGVRGAARDRRARGARRHLGATQGLRRRRLPLGVLRPLAQPLGQLVLDGGVRQSREGAQLPRPPPRGRGEAPRERARLARTAPDRDVGALDQPRHERRPTR